MKKALRVEEIHLATWQRIQGPDNALGQLDEDPPPLGPEVPDEMRALLCSGWKALRGCRSEHRPGYVGLLIEDEQGKGCALFAPRTEVRAYVAEEHPNAREPLAVLEKEPVANSLIVVLMHPLGAMALKFTPRQSGGSDVL